uniref:Uncharacterized protein n=1 Tax=Rhabditophanes sp. KR3021 TaxID=114890 RepID=A0AC35TYG8_9BILA
MFIKQRLPDMNTVTTKTMSLLLNNATIGAPHFCQRQLKMSRMACCHFVKILNDTQKIPLCDFNITSLNFKMINNHTEAIPVYISYPNEVQEDHVTFAFGIFLLLSIVLICTMVMSKLTKPKAFSRISMNYVPPSPTSSRNLDLFMWLPYCNIRRNSVLIFLRGIACGQSRQSRNENRLSIVSQSSINFLPSYQSAANCSSTTSTMISPLSLPPPPSYEESNNNNSSNIFSCRSNHENINETSLLNTIHN